jgi:hypothetical protein
VNSNASAIIAHAQYKGHDANTGFYARRFQGTLGDEPTADGCAEVIETRRSCCAMVGR